MTESSAISPHAPCGTLERWEHRDFDGTPYFDEDLQVPHGIPHQNAITYLAPALKAVAGPAGLQFLSDNPIWFLHPETGEQKVFYGDCVLARPVDPMRIIASDLLLVLEVVTTKPRQKEVKDTLFQLAVNEYNDVPEFALVFPDEDDARTLYWYRRDEKTGRYQELRLSPGASVASDAIPGLELRVRPQAEWIEGRKIDIVFRGEYLRSVEEEHTRAKEEHVRAETEKARADEERTRADTEKARAETERARAERLAARLRELGVELDPGT